MSIVVQDITKKFGLQTAVNQISFEIGKGEVVGFLGPNGAGKSTTMKMITGSLFPDAGQIHVCGIPVSPNTIASKKKIGYLAEANPLYQDMYIREYLAFIAGVHRVAKPREAIEKTLHWVGLTQESHKKIKQLSKGYKQRTGLAAALIHDPEVLILDEPTSGLDPNQIIEIRDIIRKLGQEKTILFSTHILQEVEAICNRILLINQGTLLADQSMTDLQKNQPGGRHALTVTFSDALTTHFEAELQRMQGEKINGQTWKFSYDPKTNIQKQLMEWSLKTGVTILQLQHEEIKLETLFRSLTQQASKPSLKNK